MQFCTTSQKKHHEHITCIIYLNENQPVWLIMTQKRSTQKSTQVDKIRQQNREYLLPEISDYTKVYAL